MTKALALAAIGLFMLLLAYYKIPGKFVGRFVPKISIYWDLRKAMFGAIILGILGFIFSYLRLTMAIPVQFAQIALFLSELLLIAIGILFILQLQGRLHKTGKILLWMLFLPSIFMLRLGIGLIAPVLFLGIFLLLTDWSFSGKIPWKLAIGLLLLFIFFSSVKKEFRYLTWEEETYSSKSPIEKSILFAELAYKNIKAGFQHHTSEKRASSTKDPIEKNILSAEPASTRKIAPDKGHTVAANRITHILYKGYTAAGNRIAHCLLSFARVVDFTPKVVPYWMGYSYRALLWAPIPRVIFPWKPTIGLGQEFGHRYAFLEPENYSTAWNLPQTVEMYVNFGIIGVIIGMFLMGVIYRSLYEMFCHPKSGEGSILIGLFVFMKLSLIESDFATVFGNIVYFIILLILVNKLMEGHGQRRV